MDCRRARELLAHAQDAALDAPDAGAVEEHVRRCAACLRVQGQLAALARELPALSSRTEAPPDLAARLSLRVPAPAQARRAGLRAVHLVELRRVAAWGLVFVGLWWQLAGGAVSGFTEREVLPRARAVMEHAETEVDRSGVVPLVREASDRVDGAGRAVHDVLFGERGDPARRD